MGELSAEAERVWVMSVGAKIRAKVTIANTTEAIWMIPAPMLASFLLFMDGK